MGPVRDEALRNTESLQSSLNAIFLAIGNAYYEANRNVTTKSTSPSLNVQRDKQIRQSRNKFIDSLDQLEIMVMRATEVLQAYAYKQNPAMFGPDGSAALLAMSGKEGPSPETMLLTGEGLIPSTTGEPIPELSMETPTAMTNGDVAGLDPLGPPADVQGIDVLAIPTAEAGVIGDPASQAVVQPGLDPAPGIDMDNPVLDDDAAMNLDGPIDFGDMDFENFNFDDTAHFDFGSMMED